jgi:hypothetical protein
MRLTATLLLLAALLLAPAARVRAYTLQYTGATAITQVRWPTTTINVALSTSLSNPPPYVRATGEQVVAAARRALASWSAVSNVQFNVTTRPEQDAAADGVSLITVADTPANHALFRGGLQPGRARVTFDSGGNIAEADLAVNPLVTRADPFAGEVRSFFSTDGTPDSYDLESTFVHEIGHMLGLEHSGVAGATMQPRQGANGTYNLANFSARTLSSDDIAGVRAVYGPHLGLGSISGRVSYNGMAPTASPAFGAHVVAEEVTTGRVAASNVASAAGYYRIDGLAPGQYRVVVEQLDEPVVAAQLGVGAGGYPASAIATQPAFVTTEAGNVTVASEATTTLNVSVAGAAAAVNPKFVGTGESFQLSTVAVPLEPGKTRSVLVGGNNLTLSPDGMVTGVSVNSPYISVSNVQQVDGFGITVISFDVTAGALVPPGEYSLRLTTSAGQVAYVAGVLTVEPSSAKAEQTPPEAPNLTVARLRRDSAPPRPRRGLA